MEVRFTNVDTAYAVTPIITENCYFLPCVHEQKISGPKNSDNVPVNNSRMTVGSDAVKPKKTPSI